MTFRRCLLLLFVCLALPLRAQEHFDPAHTWIFAVGLVVTDDPDLASWPQAGRPDAEMIAAFKERGVPRNHILYLQDKRATKAEIDQDMGPFFEHAQSGDTLIFYYTGHGSRDTDTDARTISFLTYDTKSDWPVSNMIDSVEQHFHGAQVLLLADCCYSGGLVRAVEKRHEPFGVGVLTSSRATSSSTGEWTFTNCIVDALKGNPMLDLNSDGQITFGELASYTNIEMAYAEKQLSSSYTAGSVTRDFVLAEKVAAKDARVGEWCEARDDGTWYRAKILKNGGDRFFVTWADYESSENCWVNANDIRPLHPKVVPTGSRVDVKSDEEGDNTVYLATVLKNRLGLCYVHYDDYPSVDDEWVSQDRLKVTREAANHGTTASDDTTPASSLVQRGSEALQHIGGK